MGDSVDNSASESGTQQFIGDLFATGAHAYVDSQYAANGMYNPNSPVPYTAGYPAGKATTFGAFVNTPAALLLGVGLIAIIFVMWKK